MGIKSRINKKLFFARNGVQRHDIDHTGVDEEQNTRFDNRKNNQVDIDLGRKLFGLILSE